MRAALFLLLAAAGPVLAASFECQRNENRVERLICSDSVVSDLDEVMARFYAGAQSALKENASCLKPDQQEWLRKRNTCKDAPCMDRVYRERLAELTPLQPGINLRRRLDVPEVPQLVGALAPETDRVMAPAIASRAGSATGQLVHDDKQGAFVIREKSGHQTIVLLDIMRGGDNATQFPVMEQVHRGATITARGRLALKDGGTPVFDRRHCVYLYRLPR
jgi:uncharacterized protein